MAVLDRIELRPGPRFDPDRHPFDEAEHPKISELFDGEGRHHG